MVGIPRIIKKLHQNNVVRNFDFMVNSNKYVYVYLEGGISRKDPEHHGDPVKDNDQEHPVREHRGVQHQHKHPAYQGY